MRNQLKYLSASLALTVLVACSPNVNTTGVEDLQQASTLANNSKSGDQIADYMSNLKREKSELEKTPPQPIVGDRVVTLPQSKTKQLTYFTYEALDNNLYKDLNRILNTLETIGSDDNINMVAQTDNWKKDNAARYYLGQDNDFSKVKSQFIKMGNEAEDSGNPNVFSDAVKWAYSSYPSKTRWLNMSTHGMGFAGIGYDDNPENNMDITSFAQAIKKGIGNQKLDIISFDACLMSTAEVASELKDVSDILIGSEDSTFYWGYGYYQTFSKIAKKPNMTTDEIARSLVLDVNNKGASNQTFTIAATDLKKIGQLETVVDELARALRKALTKERDNIFRALDKAKPFAMAEEIPFRDLNRVLSSLKDNVKDADVLSACDKVNNTLYRKGVVMLSRQSKMEKDQGRGLSIYVPLQGKVSKLYRETKFAKNTQWDEFLLDLNSTITPKNN